MPTISFKIPPNDAEAIRRAARARGLSVSEYLRRTAVAPAVRRTRARMRLEPGRAIVFGGRDAPIVTSADVAAALYE